MSQHVSAVSAPDHLYSASPERPIARTIEDTTVYYGWTRTYVFARIADGELEAVKAGRRTLVTTASAEKLFASHPRRIGRTTHIAA